MTALLSATLALIGAGAAMAAGPKAGAHFQGKTHQGHAISFDVASSGKRVEHPSVYLKTTCFGGKSSWAETSQQDTATASARIRARRKFKLHFTERAKFTGGVTARATFTISGRFTTAKRAAGTAGVTVRYSTGAVCSSGAVRFKAAS